MKAKTVIGEINSQLSFPFTRNPDPRDSLGIGLRNKLERIFKEFNVSDAKYFFKDLFMNNGHIRLSLRCFSPCEGKAHKILEDIGLNGFVSDITEVVETPFGTGIKFSLKPEIIKRLPPGFKLYIPAKDLLNEPFFVWKEN